MLAFTRQKSQVRSLSRPLIISAGELLGSHAVSLVGGLPRPGGAALGPLVWADNETDVDLLGFDFLVDALVVALTEPRLLPLTIGVLGE
jgi:hypothetical protein